MHLIWHSRRGRRRNHLWQIFWWSVEGCRFCRGSKIAISHWLSQWPLTQGWRYSAACDTNLIKIEETFCGRMDGHLRPTLLGRLKGVDLKRRHHKWRLANRYNIALSCCINQKQHTMSSNTVITHNHISKYLSYGCISLSSFQSRLTDSHTRCETAENLREIYEFNGSAIAACII